MHRIVQFPVASALAMASASASAHPGHSNLAASMAEFVHLLTSPDHLLGTLAVTVVLLVASIAGARRLARKERRDDSR